MDTFDYKTNDHFCHQHFVPFIRKRLPGAAQRSPGTREENPMWPWLAGGAILLILT